MVADCKIWVSLRTIRAFKSGGSLGPYVRKATRFRATTEAAGHLRSHTASALTIFTSTSLFRSRAPSAASRCFEAQSVRRQNSRKADQV